MTRHMSILFHERTMLSSVYLLGVLNIKSMWCLVDHQSLPVLKLVFNFMLNLIETWSHMPTECKERKYLLLLVNSMKFYTGQSIEF